MKQLAILNDSCYWSQVPSPEKKIFPRPLESLHSKENESFTEKLIYSEYEFVWWLYQIYIKVHPLNAKWVDFGKGGVTNGSKANQQQI